MNKQQRGFTLIELVAVIVLLGILAVTALPRFVNLQTDAKGAVVEGVKAAVQGAAVQVYAKSLVANNLGAIGSIDIGGGVMVNTVFGYPAATDAGIIAAINTDTSVILTAATAAAGGNPAFLTIGYTDGATTPAVAADCSFTYANSTGSGNEPAISAVTKTCL